MVSPDLDPAADHMIVEKVRDLEFGPVLVIGNIVENTYGGEEATRYVVALLNRRAR